MRPIACLVQRGLRKRSRRLLSAAGSPKTLPPSVEPSAVVRRVSAVGRPSVYMPSLPTITRLRRSQYYQYDQCHYLPALRAITWFCHNQLSYTSSASDRSSECEIRTANCQKQITKNLIRLLSTHIQFLGEFNEIGGNMLQRQFFQMLPTDVLSRLRTRTIAPQSRRQFSKRKSLE